MQRDLNNPLDRVRNESLLLSGSWSSLWSVLVDQALDVQLSDELLDDWVFEVDAGDLDLGLLWDEIHLSFSFLHKASQ